MLLCVCCESICVAAVSIESVCRGFLPKSCILFRNMNTKKQEKDPTPDFKPKTAVSEVIINYITILASLCIAKSFFHISFYENLAILLYFVIHLIHTNGTNWLLSYTVSDRQ